MMATPDKFQEKKIMLVQARKNTCKKNYYVASENYTLVSN